MYPTDFILLFLVAVALSYITARSGKPRQLPDGSLEMRCSKVTLTMGILSGVVVPCVIVLILLKMGWRSPTDLYYAIGVAVGFTAFGFFTLLSCWRIRVRLHEGGVEASTIFGKVNYVSWQDIERVVFCHRSKSFQLFGVNGERLVIDAAMTGMQEFLKKLQDDTDPAIHNEACTAYANWRKFPL